MTLGDWLVLAFGASLIVILALYLGVHVARLLDLWWNL